MITPNLGWYNCIEPGIRDLVCLLRNAGINTTCSCEHAMAIEAESYEDSDLTKIYNLLSENGYDHFRLELVFCRNPDVKTTRHLSIKLPMEDGTFCEHY